MPLVLSDINIAKMTNEQLMVMVIQTYANSDNWERYERDYGVGRPVQRTAWGIRDQGWYAREAVKILCKRGVKI